MSVGNLTNEKISDTRKYEPKKISHPLILKSKNNDILYFVIFRKLILRVYYLNAYRII